MKGLMKNIIVFALAVLMAACVMPVHEGIAREGGETLDAERFETLVTSILGRRALLDKRPQAAMEDELQFWMDTLALQCKTNACDAFEWTDDSLWRVMGLADDARSQALTRMLEAYAAGTGTAVEQFMLQDVDALFDDDTLTAQDKIYVYAALIPLLKKHAIRSNDQVRFKKLQATGETFSAHEIPTEQAIECQYAVDEVRTLWVRFPIYDWVMRHGFEPKVGVRVTPENLNTSLSCHVVVDEDSLSSEGSFEKLGHAIEALHQAVYSRDQDSIDMAGNGLLMAMRYVREERGWAFAWNPSWKGENLEVLQCKLHAVMLQLLAQDRYVLAALLDGEMGKLFPVTRFYDRLQETQACVSKLKGSYRSLLQSEYAVNSAAYEWVLANFSPKKRPKIEKAFAAWTKKTKPMVAKVRRGIASFMALSQGEFALAGAFAKGMTDNLSRANNPQVFGYDFAMVYLRGDEMTDAELALRLDALYQKSAAHMYDTLTFARRFMDKNARKQAVAAAGLFHVAPAQVAAALYQAAYLDEITADMSAENEIHWRLWTFDHARYAWRGGEREAFARQTLSLCCKTANMACVEHLSTVFAKDPLEPRNARAYWEKQGTSAALSQSCSN